MAMTEIAKIMIIQATTIKTKTQMALSRGGRGMGRRVEGIGGGAGKGGEGRGGKWGTQSAVVNP